MELSGDDLAGVVDTFGALTRDELARALAELAFKRGESADPDRFESVIDDAIDAYELIQLTDFEEPLLAVGPTAFPTRPEGTTDLRHILDTEPRDIDRERAGEAATNRLREEAALAIQAGETDRIEALIDLSYDIETWASADLSGVRSHLDGSR